MFQFKQFLQVKCCTGKTSMNSIERIGDGGGLYGEQWHLSGDRRVSIVLKD